MPTLEKQFPVMAVGKKSADILGKDFPLVSTSAIYEDLTFVTSSGADRLMEDFATEKFDKIVLIYNRI